MQNKIGFCQISFDCNHNYVYIFIYWIFEVISIVIKNIYSKNFEMFKGNLENKLFNIFCNVIADLLAFSLVIYTKFSMNIEKINKTLKRKKSKLENKLLYTNTIEEKNKSSIKLLLLISVLHLLSLSSHFLFFLFVNVEENKKSVILDYNQLDWLIPIDLISRHFFSSKILKTTMYSHHILSLFICIPGFLLMAVSDIISIIHEKKDVKILYYILFTALRGILFPLEDVINKKLLTDKFILPPTLIFFRGLIEFIILSIFTLILYFSIKLNLIYIGINLNIIIRSIFTFIIFIKTFCLIKVIDKFNAQYVSFIIIAKSFAGVLNHFIGPNKDLDEKEKLVSEIILDIFSLIIILIGTLLYNEMIVINKWGLNKKTKNELLLMGTKEMENINKFNEFNQEENNEENNEEYYEENNEENNEKNNEEKIDEFTIN